MTTARYLITNALRTVGVVADSQPLNSDDAQNGLNRLNDLIDSWAGESLYAYTTVEYFAAGVNGTTVSIGPTATIVTPSVPTRTELVKGYTRNGGLDFGFDLIDYDQYSAILLKSLVASWPIVGYYDGNGTLALYPVPTNAEIHIGVDSRIVEFASLDTDYVFNPAFRRALGLTLAEELAPDYSRALDPSTVQLARSARRLLKRVNHVTPDLDMGVRGDSLDRNLGFGGVPTYDGVSDPA